MQKIPGTFGILRNSNRELRNHLIRISHVMVFICGTEYIIWDTVLLLVIYGTLIVDAHPSSSPGIHYRPVVCAVLRFLAAFAVSTSLLFALAI